MFSTIRGGLIGAFAATSMLASVAFSAPVYWFNDPNNSFDAGNITVSGGSSDKGLYGNPTPGPNPESFYFFPSNFVAESINGTPDRVNDRISFTVTADPGLEIRSLYIRELGDWDIVGNGTVKAFGTLYITKLAGPGGPAVLTKEIDVTYDDTLNNVVYQSPLRPVTEGNGQWTGLFEVALPEGITSAQIVFNNILTATTGPGGLATIAKKVIGDPAGTDGPMFEIGVLVPEPASLGLIGLGGLLLVRRRRD